MTKDLSRNSAYCAAREAISKQHRGWEKKLEFVGRTEQAWRQARAREARLQDEWVLLELQEDADVDVRYFAQEALNTCQESVAG